MANSTTAFETIVEKHDQYVMVGLRIIDPNHPHERIRMAGISRYRLSQEAVHSAFDRLTNGQTPVMPDALRAQSLDAAIAALKL